LSAWFDIHRGLRCASSIPLTKPCGDVRLALLMGFAKATEEIYKDSSLQFKVCECIITGRLRFIKIHLATVLTYWHGLPINKNYVACSIFLDKVIPEHYEPLVEFTDGSTKFDKLKLKAHLRSYMTCNIDLLNGQKSNDIFIFLTELFPKCRLG